eukprot:1787697-Rhodomonas_salina.1
MCKGHIAYNVGQAKGFKGEKDDGVLVGGLSGRLGEVCWVDDGIELRHGRHFSPDVVDVLFGLSTCPTRPVPTRLHVVPPLVVYPATLTILDPNLDMVGDVQVGQAGLLIGPHLPLSLWESSTQTDVELQKKSSRGIAKLTRRLGDVEIYLEQQLRLHHVKHVPLHTCYGCPVLLPLAQHEG